MSYTDEKRNNIDILVFFISTNNELAMIWIVKYSKR